MADVSNWNGLHNYMIQSVKVFVNRVQCKNSVSFSQHMLSSSKFLFVNTYKHE